MAGLAGSSCRLGSQEQRRAEIDASLYIPKAQLLEDRSLILDFMDEHPFIELITSVPTLRITHLPVLLDRAAESKGSILGHLARNNPQSRAFDGNNMAVAVFRGPHGYISPTWFEKKDSVPTWNFAVVHASGRPRAITERKRLRLMLDRLIDAFEKHQGSSYKLSKLPDDYVASLMEGIVGFEMEIELLEAKFKLGQNWSGKDKQAALEHLQRNASPEPSLYDLSSTFFKHENR